jgi:hypothetical protein
MMATAESLSGSNTAGTFFSDVAVHARLLITVPLLILAEGDAIPWFDRVAHHFLASGLVGERDRPRYDHAIRSTRRLLEAKSAEFIAFLLAYAIVVLLVSNLDHDDAPDWYWADPGLVYGLSAAGVWHAFVSVPLLMVLVFGWVWRLLLWWRFLGLMALLDLRIFPSHPDRAGGLRFVSVSIRGYRLIGLAISTLVAGTQIDFLHRYGHPAVRINESAVGVVAFVVLLAVGPLVVFLMRLRETRFAGMFSYGELGREAGVEFEKKWLDPTQKIAPSVLETNDFSAMADLNQVVGNVYQVNDVPFTLRDVTQLAVVSALPFLPVALMAEPIGDILQLLKKLLL